MNTADIIIPIPRPPPQRVRIVNDPRITGTVFAVDEDGTVYWVGDDRACHASAPGYVEACS